MPARQVHDTRHVNTAAVDPSLALPPAAPCERCGQPWICGMNGPAPCACTTVQLDADTLAALRTRYQRCLCLACLQQLAQGGTP
ncbi:MAG: hypothetical protein RLZZ584_3762, partial [Pseudomonadota bacterium]